MLTDDLGQAAHERPTAPEHDWAVRRMVEGDEAELLSLYRAAFGRARDPGHFRWKLLSHRVPYTLCWVASLPFAPDGTERNKVIGHYGGIPLSIKLGGRVVPAVHAVEAMTDPAFRRRGLLTALGSAAHAEWASAGNGLVIGLPNEQWGTRNRALGYRPLFPLSWLRFPLRLDRVVMRSELPPAATALLRIPLRMASLAWRLLKAAPVPGVAVVPHTTSDGDAKLDRILGHASAGWANMVRRDSAWVNWRYLRAAPNPYTLLVAWEERQPVGYIAFRVTGDLGRLNGYVADIFVRRGAWRVLKSLVSHALRRMEAEGAGTVMCLAPPGSWLYGALRRSGFLPTPRWTAFNFEVVPLAPDLRLEELAGPDQWHLTGGDFDVI